MGDDRIPLKSLLFALLVGVVIPPGVLSARETCPLLKALRKEYSTRGDVHVLAKKLAPAVKKAKKETIWELTGKLNERYQLARMSLDETMLKRAAHLATVLALAGKEAKSTLLHGSCLLIPWQDLYETAGSVLMSGEEKVTEAETLARMWEPLWEDLFLAVMKEHGHMEAKGDETSMKQYMTQMEIMAGAWKEAFGKDDLLKKFGNFKEALEKWRRLAPEKRKSVQDIRKEAQAALRRAEYHFTVGEFDSAIEILQRYVIPKFSTIKDHRGLMRAFVLLTKIMEELGREDGLKRILMYMKVYLPFIKDRDLKTRWKREIEALEKKLKKKK